MPRFTQESEKTINKKIRFLRGQNDVEQRVLEKEGCHCSKSGDTEDADEHAAQYVEMLPEGEVGFVFSHDRGDK